MRFIEKPSESDFVRDKFSRMPDDIYLLHIMHNIGAIDSERALPVEEIARWASMEKQRVEENLNKLVEKGYATLRVDSEVKRYFVTIDGIRKVLSIYS
ncbi:MAG: helix-turn-helix domain-containing protein [Candidatus Bathyarchaeia archaeon]|nr:MarR family transcriptional regulator [Candidatus Bathyarchaeota archaeon]